MKCYVVQKKSVHYSDDYYIDVPKPQLFAEKKDAEACLADLTFNKLDNYVLVDYDGSWTDLISESNGFYGDKRKDALAIVKKWPPEYDNVTEDMRKELVPFYESNYAIYSMEIK